MIEKKKRKIQLVLQKKTQRQKKEVFWNFS